MDPRDGLLLGLDGVACTACGASVPVDGIRIVAHRDDVAFVELRCPTCGRHGIDVTTERAGISHEDVRSMREHLATWRGDLLSLIDAR
jgi:hypothetical protein